MRDDQESLIGHLIHVASKLALEQGLQSGYRIVINDGKEARYRYPNIIICSSIRFSFTCSCHRRQEVWLATCLILVLMFVTKNIYKCFCIHFSRSSFKIYNNPHKFSTLHS